MLFRIFKSNQPILLLLIPIIGLSLWVKAFFSTSMVGVHIDTLEMPLYEWCVSFIHGNSTIGIIIAFLFIIVQAFIINRLNTVFILVEGRTYLPALFFILIASCFSDLHQLNPAILGNFFILFAIYKLLSTFKKERAYSEIFDAAFLLSLGSLFYFGAIYFVLALWIGIIILRPFDIREWLISLIGLVAPYSIIATWYYYTDNLPGLLEKYTSNFAFIDITSKLNVYYYIMFGLILLFLLLSMFRLLSGIAAKKITTRKYFVFFIWLIIISFAALGISFGSSFEVLVVAAIPASYMLTHQFSLIRSAFWGELWFTIFVAAIFVANYLN